MTLNCGLTRLSAKVLVLAGLSVTACGGQSPETSALAGGCPATQVPTSVLSDAVGMRDELRKSRAWQSDQGEKTVRGTRDQDLVSATVSVASIRRTKSERALMSDAARERLVRVHAGVPTSNGFYTFPLSVDLKLGRSDVFSSLSKDLNSQMTSLKAHLMDTANAPEADSETRSIANRVSEELGAAVDALGSDGMPVYALEFANLGAKEARRITAARAAGAIVTVVPQGCDLAKPAYPAEAAEAWGAVEERAPAGPTGPPPEAPAG